MKRQGLIINLVCSRLGDRTAALLFLNTHHPALGGRPLDVAGESGAGFERVRGEIAGLVPPPLVAQP